MKKKSKIPSNLYIALCFVFFYVPILVTMIFSFNSSKSLTKFSGFSLRWYEALLNNQDILSAVWVSVSIAVLATAISTVLGTITAIGLSKSKKVLKEWLLSVNDIPIMNPDIVTAIGLMILFSSIKLEKGYMTMLISHIMFCTPYVITSVYPKVRSLDPGLPYAAMDLGATPFQALVKVIVPMIKPGIFAGMLLAFTMSFDDFVISYFVTGTGVSNVSIIVYNMTKRTNPTINALSTIVIIVIFIALLVVNLVPLIARKRKTNSRIKKGFLYALSGIVLVLIFAAAIGLSRKKQELRLYMPSEYIDTELKSAFEEEYNCKVTLTTFDSNETMYTKLQSGEIYDILIPSDYMIERLVREDYLQPIDWSKIPNASDLNPDVLGCDFDPDNTYSVPYFWGSVGILYDKTMVDEADAAEGWDLLINTKYKDMLYMYDSERDSFMVALKALGYSMNTTNMSEYNAAYDWLVRQRDTMNPVVVGDDVIDNMISGNKAIAVVYSGDAAYIISENENLAYTEPKQGTNLWYDCMVITQDCENTDLAHKFINFMLDYDSAYANTAEVGYTSPVTQVYNDVKDTDFEGISAYTPRVDGDKDECFHYQDPDIKAYCAEHWTKAKAK